MSPIRIGFLGNLPKPYGGVATTCYQLTEQFLAKGHCVYFHDRTFSSEKDLPAGLTGYKMTERRSLVFAAKQFANAIFRRALTDARYRGFLTALISGMARLRLSLLAKSSLSIVLEAIELAEFLNAHQPQVVHSQHAGVSSFAALVVAQHYLRIPFIVTVHSSEFTMAAHARWLPLARHVVNQADAVVCVSNYSKTQTLQSGATPSFVTVVYHGVNPIHFKPVEETFCQMVTEKFQIFSGQKVILFTGWLIERKGPQVLVQALAALNNRQDWKALLVGPDHGYKHQLEELVAQHNLSGQVIISDAIPYPELLALYSLADIFVFPTLSRDEGFGLVALEAMAHGAPVLAADTGAIPEVVVDQETGLFFSPGDHQALATLIERLLDDEPLRARMSAAAKKWAATFRWDLSAERILDVYRQVINAHD